MNNQKNKKEMWLWLLQRLTAILIFFVIFLHIWNVHYADLGGPVTFMGVLLRLKNILIYFSDTCLLFLGLFHGLNGIRAVLLDFSFFNKYDKIISWVLAILGIIFFIIGVRGLWVFIAIK